MGVFVACAEDEIPSTNASATIGSTSTAETNSNLPEDPAPETDVTASESTSAPSESTSDPSESTEESTQATSSDSEGDPTENKTVYDPTIEHKIIVGDIYGKGHGTGTAKLAVLDLNKCDGNWNDLTSSKALVWEWGPNDAAAGTLARSSIRGFSDAKYRYSEHYDRYVVIACNSAGWFGIIDYETKEVLWESKVANGPHSIELMPNGDFVMVGSGGSADGKVGSIYYYPLSVTESTKPSSTLPLKSAHGVQWDPDLKCLWVVYMQGIQAVNVANYGTAKASLQMLDDMGDTFEEDSSGHDLAPVAGSPKEYWVTATNYVWIFNTETEELSRAYPNSEAISQKKIKGIASFKDGTVVTAAAGVSGKGQELSYTYTTYDLNIITVTLTSDPSPTEKITKTQVTFDKREFYKVHSFDAAYKP